MKRIWVNKAKSFKEAELFNMKFWRSAGAQARFRATWSLIKDFYRVKGMHGDNLRLQRSIEHIGRI